MVIARPNRIQSANGRHCRGFMARMGENLANVIAAGSAVRPSRTAATIAAATIRLTLPRTISYAIGKIHSM